MKKTLKTCIIELSALGGMALALSACGDDVTKVTNVTTETIGMEVTASADSLGRCDSSTIGKMIFVADENAAYVCADSGWVPLSPKASDGRDGTVGSSCTAERLSDSSGYRIVCGEDSVGVILNGINGTDGQKGDTGESCKLTDNEDGTVTLACGANEVVLDKSSRSSSSNLPQSSSSNSLRSSSSNLCTSNVSYGTLTDARDQRTYKTVEIGSQTWMAENLNYAGTSDSTVGVCYDENEAYCDIYGRLYTFTEANSVCPAGYHLPTGEEWITLKNYVGNSFYNGNNDSVGFALKSQTGWDNEGNGFDKVGFCGLPAGGFTVDNTQHAQQIEHSFRNVRTFGGFWQENQETDLLISVFYLEGNSAILGLGSTSDFLIRYSVRCIRDAAGE